MSFIKQQFVQENLIIKLNNSRRTLFIFLSNSRLSNLFHLKKKKWRAKY